ncbi:MAG: hypothetical protein ACON4Z_06460 [Planctomycetota bacterium]
MLLLTCALLPACASPGLPPMVRADRVERDVSYRAEVFSGKWPRAPDARAAATAEPEPESAAQVTFGCRVLRLSGDELSGWLGDPRAVCAWDAPAGSAAGLLGAPRVEVLTAPRLVLNSGAQGTLSTLDQQAFVAGFDVVGDGAAVLADPVVEVAQEGFRLQVCATIADGGVRLEVAADFVAVQGLDAPREVQLPVGAPVHLQQPVTCAQRVAVDAPVAPGRELLVRLPGEQPGDARLLVLRCQPVDGAHERSSGS